jgi:hypothetical protein
MASVVRTALQRRIRSTDAAAGPRTFSVHSNDAIRVLLFRFEKSLCYSRRSPSSTESHQIGTVVGRGLS